MSDSGAATLNADQNCVGGIQNTEPLREKWKRVKVKKEEVDRDLQQEKKYSDKILGLQNGLNETGSPRGVKGSVRSKGNSGVDLGVHLKNSHPDLVIQPQKTSKLLQLKTVKQRMQNYSCLKCKGKSFASSLSLQRHLLLHISLPEIKLTRLIKEEDKSEDLEVVPSGRLQVARKRITVSSLARSPLKFRLMCTNVNDGKDSFKLVKSTVQDSEKPAGSDAPQKDDQDIPEEVLNSTSFTEVENTACESEGKVSENLDKNKETTVPGTSKEENRDGDENSETEKLEIKASVDPWFNVPIEEQSRPSFSENSKDCPSTSAKVEDPPSTPSKAKDSPASPSKSKDSPRPPSKAKDSAAPPSDTKDNPIPPSKAKDPSTIPSKAKDCPTPSKVKDSPAAPLKAKESLTPSLKKTEKQGRDERIMRQMKNVESEMEKMQSKSPSVLQNSHDPRQIAGDKNGLSSSSEAECDSLQPEFIPIERLEKDGPPPLISATANSMVQPGLAPQENVSEAHILCEACGETIIGDQTALEDHCLCRGHYKCPICSVACASTDSLAVHSKESHPNADLSAHLTERKKKSGLRSARQKHAEILEKDVSRDSLSDLSNSPSIPSPSADIRTPPLPSPTGVRVSEALQNSGQNKRHEALMSVARVHEQDVRRNSPSSLSTAGPPEVAGAPNNYSIRGSSQQAPQIRLPPGRVSDIMPPPLMRPPNGRNNDPQPRSSMGNVPMQAPPALYKVPVSHGMSNTQPTPSLQTIPSTAYIRGIPASGYQPDLQAASAANPFASSASNHLVASAAALNARYQTMHHGYPPGSQPQPGYAAFTQPMQAQQRYQMAPPPPYPNQLPPHLQQNPRAPIIPQNVYGMPNSQQAYNQSLLKAQLEQARMQLPQPSAMLQSMQNLQQEHYQQQQLQQQLFQQPHHQLMQQAQQEQIRAPVPPQQQTTQKRKSNSSNPSHLRYHHQTALQNQQQLQSQLQQSAAPPPAKQRRHRDNIGIPSKQTDSDCEIIAVQQRGEGVPVIQSIQGANASPNGDNSMSGSDSSNNSTSASVPTTSESTIHLTDSITLSVRQPPGSSSVSGSKGHSANAVASILATRGITVTPASGAAPSRSSGGSSSQRARPSPPLNHSQTSSPSQSAPMTINSAISISHSSRPPHQANEGFAVPAPVAPQRTAQRQPPPTADRPPRPPTVDLTDENAHALAANSIVTCRLCDKQFPSNESLQQHMHVIHQTRNYFRCSICNTKHPSQQALSNHIKRVHKFGSASGSPPELVIPLVDLKNTGAMTRLSNLGVNYVISLNQLGMSSDSSTFCIPIMSLDSNGQARNNSISGLMSMGTSAVLPIGPVKSLPAAQQQPQPPQNQQPQMVPSLNQVNTSLPPGAPLRGAPHQYVQASNQGAPR